MRLIESARSSSERERTERETHVVIGAGQLTRTLSSDWRVSWPMGAASTMKAARAREVARSWTSMARGERVGLGGKKGW